MNYSSFLQKHLGRITSSGEYIAEIDGLRFIAIMAVVLFHICSYLESHVSIFATQDLSQDVLTALFNSGNFGVMLFFTISGFVLSLPFARQYLLKAPPIHLRHYYLRRLTRIEPPYIIAMVLSYVLIITFKHPYALDLLGHLIASLTYMHNIVYGAPSTLSVVAWSLEVEVQFYILAPLLAKLFYCNANPLIRRSLIGVTILAFALASERLSQPMTLLSFLHYFLVGFLLSDIYCTSDLKDSQRTALFDYLGVGAWSTMLCSLQRGIWTDILSPWCILTAYYCAFKGPVSHKFFSFPWLTVIGGMCYTIYLYHLLIISALGRFSTHLIVGCNFPLNLILQTIILVPGILVASALLFIVTERPFMRRFFIVHPDSNH